MGIEKNMLLFDERYLTSFVLTELTFQRKLHLNYYYNIRIKMFINIKTDYLLISRLYDYKMKDFSFYSCLLYGAGFLYS